MGTGSIDTQYHGIVHGSTRGLNVCSANNVHDGQVEKPVIRGYGQLKSKNTDKYWIESLRKSNAQQSDPQRVDLNVHANLSAVRHA